MNIAFDATAILGPMSKHRGIGNYGINLFKTLISSNKDIRFFCFNVFPEKITDNYIAASDNFYEKNIYVGEKLIIANNDKYEDLFGSIISQFIFENKIDIFIITSPFDRHIMRYKKKWFGHAIVTAIIYDIIPFVFKKRYLIDKNSQKWYMSCVDSLRELDAYFAISQSVKDDLINYLKFPQKNIYVIWGACSSIYKKIEINDKCKKALLNKYGINKKFVICTGGDDARKNIDGLIRAFGAMQQELIDQYELVIVCKLGDQSKKDYLNLAQRYGIANNVVFTGYVTDEELLGLYNLAYVCAFPSKYEGFGLPITEAFSCDIPVLTSNNSSLVQIAGNAAILVNPNKDHDITKGLEKILSMDVSELKDRGKERLKIFNWTSVANNMLIGMKTLYGDFSYVIKAKKRIAYFSHLPPLRSGVADYSFDILNEISKYFDIDVFIDDGYTPSVILPDNVQVFNYKEYRHENYYNTVFQVGNSEFHIYMFPFIQKYRGIIELHDFNLHGVVQDMYWKNGNLNKYQQILNEDSEVPEISNYLEQLKSGGTITTNPYEYQVNGFVTHYSNTVIVHSNWAKMELLKRNIGIKTDVVFHYSASIVRSSTASSKDNNCTCVISCFGIIAETKRAYQIVKALEKVSKDGYEFKFYFVGENILHEKKSFEEEIEKSGLGSKVVITGYASMDDFEKYMQQTDICLNLRYPYNGESSGTLARMLGMGKCIIVNNIGSFSEVPDCACYKISNPSQIGEEQEI
jgi:glycosyltransferase involved in cell wall biosynthesis